MFYLSTRGTSHKATLSEAIRAGLAPDGGLYVPDAMPQLSVDDFAGQTTLPEMAEPLLRQFFAGDQLEEALPAIIQDAFQFPAPLQPVPALNADILELFHGPTAAFKDFGARFLAACLSHLAKGDDRPLTIVVATSGDTGAAVGSAFHGKPSIKVCILYPEGRVSPRQAHQLGCFGDNVRTFAVQGSFDDCQRLAKWALNNKALQAKVPMSSANSISLGRLLPQMTYYTHIALQRWRQYGEKAHFIIPTGNLGNALACIWAREMGLPIGDIQLVTNANTTLPEFFRHGEYRPRASIKTLANAMDVGAPSNFERLRWLWQQKKAPLTTAFYVNSVDDEAIRHTITTLFHNHGVVVCPHTATALHRLAQLRKDGDQRHWVCASTAHPAKFDTIVEPLVGQPVPLPDALRDLLDEPSHAEPMAADEKTFESVLMD